MGLGVTCSLAAVVATLPYQVSAHIHLPATPSIKSHASKQAMTKPTLRAGLKHAATVAAVAWYDIVQLAMLLVTLTGYKTMKAKLLHPSPVGL